MSRKAIIFIILTGSFFLSCTKNENLSNNNSRLWYRYPAKYWNSQALHLGNGYFGASFFGGTDEETFALSEKSFWTGGPAQGDWTAAGVNPKAKEALPLIRQAILNGNIHRADSLVKNDFFGSADLFGHFSSVGNLNIKFHGQKTEPENYMRALDLENSLGLVQYDIGNTRYYREYFCSYPDRVLAMRFSAGSPGRISFDLSMEILQDSSIIEITENTYQVKGYINENHRLFHVLISIRNAGGTVGQDGGSLIVRGSDTVEVYLTIATDYKMEYPDYTGADPEKITQDIIRNVVHDNYESLKMRHISDYKSLYDRVNLSLEGNQKAEKLPTNERYQNLKSGGSDPGYKTLAFNLGRYLIISSSRQHTLPANLQGVWNTFLNPPWAGNYQSNINLQEIYWSCGPTDLAECQQAYIDWIDNLSISGKEIAERVYGTHGWVSHTTGNIWGHAAPYGDHPWGLYPMGAAWHCQVVWDQFAFTGDTGYLRTQAFPLLRDASVFWLENLVRYNGYYITAPSVSAEHGALMTEDGLNPAFHDSISDKYVYCLPGIYQDIEMLWDLFTNTSSAARILGEQVFADSLLQVRQNLLPLKIGKYGQLQEWYEDMDNPECHHRHIAHLYAVCPGRQISPVKTPELARAAKKSLDMRGDGRFLMQELASGGNWARAHRMWCWTRLMDGNRAHKIMTEMLTGQGFENGLTYQHADYHWERKDLFKEGELYCHFQLDGSASIPGCIAEMLVQSHTGEIHLLPALPDEWNSGKINGLKARGGYKINMEWKKGKLIRAEIIAEKESPLPVVRVKDKIIDIADSKIIRFIIQN
ncbi:MAG: glycoside hydrolase family 95 protein [Bacteroidales bacterium]|nr:glycoside hydrolase family 95 protein [Bacteroidales bacterium]